MKNQTMAAEGARTMLAFGPVPSRRLGQSLGINNVPPKTCSYSCVYCQVGRTTRMRMRRAGFYQPQEIFQAVKERLEGIPPDQPSIDYLSFVPDGEPTLDAMLGQEIDLMRPLGVRIAVISNASLIFRPQVQRDLSKADFISLKVDAVQEGTWRKINRPHHQLDLQAILDGMLAFNRRYGGKLVTETMLVRGLNDDPASLEAIAAFLDQLQPAIAYLAVPTRPPAESWTQPPSEETLHRAYQIFSARLPRVEFLVSYEGDSFSVGSNVIEDLLGIMAVHPMREQAVIRILQAAGSDQEALDQLLAQGVVARVSYGGNWFYMRRFPRP